MNTMDKKVELLAPAGNFEKLEIAVHYGADAVYLGGKDFNLRNFAANFSNNEMRQAIDYAHKRGVNVYVTCNIYPRNADQKAIDQFLHFLGSAAPDAIIIADPGIFTQARQIIPHIPIHVSTQANTTSIQSVLFWEKLGAKRVNPARELALQEIAAIVKDTTSEVEVFVHGAMCISYSGRCLLSSFMAQRDSNRGMCTHPCRWRYTVMEATRPGQHMPICEDQRGTYIFNSKDLCMIEHIPALAASGISAFKIEGRMKGINYLAATVKTYREAIDAYYADPTNYYVQKRWIDELNATNNRGFCTGFYFGNNDQISPAYEKKPAPNPSRLLAKVIEKKAPSRIKVDVRNKMVCGDKIYVLSPGKILMQDTIADMMDQEDKPLKVAQPGMTVTIGVNGDVDVNDLIRSVPKTSSS
ncbi:MAG: U32 family peptidase [Desulfobacterales bacterium]|nr:U32 family peptidase [Desulfobacterales bacterium]